MSRYQFDNPSLSRKGCGGLVACEDRFKRFQYITPAPGPGNYDCKLNFTTPTPVRYAQPETRSFVEKFETPSPGHYNPRLSMSPRDARSAFNSTSKKCMLAKNETPAPWHYKTGSGPTPSKLPSPVFRLPVKARRYQINLYDPHAELTKEEMPGPGHYSFDERQETSIKSSYMFLESNLDRFGLQKRQKRSEGSPPGPGAYYIGRDDFEKTPVAGAVFMSETERVWLNAEKKPPGPAFYRPIQMPKKKSFHLNANRLWL